MLSAWIVTLDISVTMMQARQLGSSNLILREQVHELVIHTTPKLDNEFPSMQCLNTALTQLQHKITSNKKTVSFSTVEIREHAVILGDNPNCPLPLSIGWKRAKHSVVMDVQRYEDLQQRYGRRRNKKPTPIDVYLRRIRLKEMGYSGRTLDKARKKYEVDCRRKRKTCQRRVTRWKMLDE